MERILEIGANVSTPLGLAGFASALVLLGLRSAIKAGLLTKATKKASSQILLRVINYLFVLALSALMIGGAGYVAGVMRGADDVGPRRVSGTVLDTAEILAQGVLVAIAGTNTSDQTNQNGFFQLEVPQHLRDRDSIVLFVGNPVRGELRQVAATEGLVIRLTDRTPAGAMADAPSVPADEVARQSVPPEPRTERSPEAPIGTGVQRGTSLVGLDIRVVTDVDRSRLGEAAAERLRTAGAFVTLTQAYRLGGPNTASGGRVVYQSAQEAAARRVQAALDGLVKTTLELAGEAGGGRTLVVYLPNGQ